MTGRRSMLVAGVVVFAAAGCGGGAGSKDATPAPGGDKARAALEKLDGEATAKRVGALRGLEFTDGVPKLKIVKPSDTTAYVRRQVERNYPADRFEADEDFYQLTGIVPADASLRELLDKFSGNLILGYYDRENPGELNMVTSERAAQPKAAESTLAHELTHALQDQSFGLKRRQGIEDPDRSTAASALVEGDAQLLELAYGKKYLAGGPKAMPETGGLPPAVLLYALFPYEFGSKFVATLVKKAGGYELVDKAWRTRPPETSEQILHPKKYLSGEQAREVRPPKVLGSGWKAEGALSFGELDALAVLSTKTLPKGPAGKALGRAVEGWDGGARTLFTRGRDRALVVNTTWESAKDAREFAAAYARSLKKDRGGKKASGDVVEIPDVGFATVAAADRDVTFAIAPDAKLAGKLTASVAFRRS